MMADRQAYLRKKREKGAFAVASCHAAWAEVVGRLHELSFIFPFRISDESKRIKVDVRHQRSTGTQIEREILISIG